MQHAHMDFIEAVENLAQKAGLQVPYADNHPHGSAARHEHLLQALATAADLFHRQLYASDAAVAYLKHRRIDRDTAAKFKLGLRRLAVPM